VAAWHRRGSAPVREERVESFAGVRGFLETCARRWGGCEVGCHQGAAAARQGTDSERLTGNRNRVARARTRGRGPP
jgi:hypothetical protein